MPEPYLDSFIAECDFIKEGHFSTNRISKIVLQFVMSGKEFLTIVSMFVRNSRSVEP